MIFFQLEKCVYEEGNYLLFSCSCCRLFSKQLAILVTGRKIKQDHLLLEIKLLCFLRLYLCLI